MAKMYFVVVRSKDVAAAVLDLEKLPHGVHSEIVEPPWQHGADIMGHLNANVPLIFVHVDELATGTLSAEASEFFSETASLWENLPPPTDGQAKDCIFASIDAGEKASQFTRTSPEIALDMYHKFRNIHDR